MICVQKLIMTWSHKSKKWLTSNNADPLYRLASFECLAICDSDLPDQEFETFCCEMHGY